MSLDITPKERDDLVFALGMRIAVVETGDPILRASDAIQMGKPHLVRALSESQRALIAQQEALMKKLLNTRS